MALLRSLPKKPAAPRAPSVGTRLSPGTVPMKTTGTTAGAAGSRTPTTTANPIRRTPATPRPAHPRAGAPAAPSAAGTSVGGAFVGNRAPVATVPQLRQTPTAPGTMHRPTLPPGVLDYQRWMAWHAAQKNGAPWKTDVERRDAYWAYRAARGATVPGSPQAAAAASAAAAPPPAPLRFDPSVLDAQGEGEMADWKAQLREATGLDVTWDPAAQKWNTTQLAGDADGDGIPDGGTLNRNLADQIRGLALQRLQYDQQGRDGMQAADRNAAARGMFNSGIRDMNRARVAAQLKQAMDALAAQEAAARSGYDDNWRAAVGAYTRGADRVALDSWNRRWPQYLATTGPA